MERSEEREGITLTSVSSTGQALRERGLWRGLLGVVGVVVFVLLSGMLGGVGCDSDAVFEHQVGELTAVDQADVLGSDGDGLGGLSGCVGEVGCCDEDAPGGSVGFEAS